MQRTTIFKEPETVDRVQANHPETTHISDLENLNKINAAALLKTPFDYVIDYLSIIVKEHPAALTTLLSASQVKGLSGRLFFAGFEIYNNKIGETIIQEKVGDLVVKETKLQDQIDVAFGSAEFCERYSKFLLENEIILDINNIEKVKKELVEFLFAAFAKEWQPFFENKLKPILNAEDADGTKTVECIANALTFKVTGEAFKKILTRKELEPFFRELTEKHTIVTKILFNTSGDVDVTLAENRKKFITEAIDNPYTLPAETIIKLIKEIEKKDKAKDPIAAKENALKTAANLGLTLASTAGNFKFRALGSEGKLLLLSKLKSLLKELSSPKSSEHSNHVVGALALQIYLGVTFNFPEEESSAELIVRRAECLQIAKELAKHVMIDETNMRSHLVLAGSMRNIVSNLRFSQAISAQGKATNSEEFQKRLVKAKIQLLQSCLKLLLKLEEIKFVSVDTPKILACYAMEILLGIGLNFQKADLTPELRNNAITCLQSMREITLAGFRTKKGFDKKLLAYFFRELHTYKDISTSSSEFNETMITWLSNMNELANLNDDLNKMFFKNIARGLYDYLDKFISSKKHEARDLTKAHLLCMSLNVFADKKMQKALQEMQVKLEQSILKANTNAASIIKPLRISTDTNSAPSSTQTTPTSKGSTGTPPSNAGTPPGIAATPPRENSSERSPHLNIPKKSFVLFQSPRSGVSPLRRESSANALQGLITRQNSNPNLSGTKIVRENMENKLTPELSPDANTRVIIRGHSIIKGRKSEDRSPSPVEKQDQPAFLRKSKANLHSLHQPVTSAEAVTNSLSETEEPVRNPSPIAKQP